MAKQIKTAIIAAIVVFAIASGIPPELLIASAQVMAVTTFVGTLAAGVVGKMTSKGLEANNGNFGTKVTRREPIAPRQLIYGKCRVGGTFVHMETTGTDNFLLHSVIAIAGHEIEELINVRFNDKDLTTSTSTINGSTVHTVTNSDFTNTENQNNFGSGRLMRFTISDGSQTAVDGYMNARLNSMGTTDKFLDIAYVYIEMVYDTEKFGSGIPAISFLVKGKKVFDPRSNATAWSDNPALCIRDFLSNTQYGIKAKTTELNDTTNAGGFSSAANTCEQNVTLADGSTTEKRYTANGFSNFSATGSGIIEGLLSSMAGKMSYVNGQFCVFAGASQTPSLTITDDELLSDLNISTNPNAGNLFNSIKPIYVDSTQNYTAADAEVYQDSTFLNADTPSGESTANYVKQMETQLPFTVTDTMAQRLARIALKSQRQTTSLSCLVSLEFMRCQPNDWVYMTNERLGYSQKVFEVISTNMEIMDSGDVPVMATRLQLKEVAASVFNFATSDYTTGQSEGSDVTIGSYAVTAPSNLALAQQTNKEGVTTKVDIKASWTNNSSDKVTLTEVAYKLSTDSAFTSDFTVGKGVAVALLPNVVVGKTYNVKARHIDVNGVTSAYTSVVNIAIAAPTDAPAVPQSLTASSGEPFSILVSWINSTSADLKATKIYRRTSNSTPTDDTYLVDTILGANGKKTTTVFGPQDGLTAGTTYYFWVRSVNQSDVHSAFTSVATGNFTNIAAGDIVDGSITAVKIAARAVENAKIAVNAIQGDVIAAGAIVEAKLGTDAVTNAKLADNAVNTAQIVADAISTAKIATGAITSSELGTDAVTNAKLADNAVQTAQLADNAITSTKITDNAITSGKIVANAITTAKINAGAVVANSISSNAITAVKIAADAVTADKVAANSIVAGSIVSNAITTAKINAGAVVADSIATNAVTANKIIADAITADKIAANAVVAAKISAGAVVAGKLAADSIVASNIQANAITAVKINADAVTADKVAANAIVAENITADAVTADKVAANAIVADNITSNAITTDKINADAITTAKIAAGAVTATEITSGTITATQIASNTITADRINVTDLALDFSAATVSGSTIGSWQANQMRLRLVAELGTATGVYHIFCRVFGGSGQVKTLSIVAGDGTFGGFGNELTNYTAYQDGTAPTIPTQDQGYAQYHSGQSQYWSAIDRFDSSYEMVQKDFMVRKISNTSRTLRLYILAQGDGSNRQLTNVQYGVYRFTEI